MPVLPYASVQGSMREVQRPMVPSATVSDPWSQLYRPRSSTPAFSVRGSGKAIKESAADLPLARPFYRAGKATACLAGPSSGHFAREGAHLASRMLIPRSDREHRRKPRRRLSRGRKSGMVCVVASPGQSSRAHRLHATERLGLDVSGEGTDGCC